MAYSISSFIGRARSVIATSLIAGAAVMAFSAPSTAQIPGVPAIPKIPAFLPTVDTVPEGEPMAIDGLWRISSLGKRIRIERGRAYAVDSWLHLFVLQIGPDMVVLQNFQRERAGVYTADDLPLQGRATFRLTRDGNIRTTVAGLLGPVSYTLVKVREDDRRALDDEIAAMSGGGGDRDRDRYDDRDRDRPDDRERDRADDRRDGGSTSLADCKKIGVDSRTGDVVCKD
tara:strand:+ start:1297 stop:1983 length:687 start_codon:yes stop_codon:yes gene_type:complete